MAGQSEMKWLLFFTITGLALAMLLFTILSALDPASEENDGDLALGLAHGNRRSRRTQNWPVLDDSPNNLFWIIQVSDLHISQFHDLLRGSDLQEFCKEYLPVINPKLVLLTGDLTDAKLIDGIGSKQHETEWILYSSIIKRCSSLTNATWLDVRGNHDSFDVRNYESENNYYRKFSVHGSSMEKASHFERAYVHNLKLPYGTYSFIGFDACSKPGLHRPFNFFGYLDQGQVQHLRSLAHSTRKSNHTIWFGHFPTSLIVHDPPILRSVMRPSIAYLCGHLHTLNNMVPRMFSRHKTGQLELELGDWKENRIFRVLAFDHDLMSFTDARLGEWPLVIITNPKDSQFLSAETEPLEMLTHSTHIRILVFSPDPKLEVVVYIDKHLKGHASHISGPLYTLAWQPEYYIYGLHNILVKVKDARGGTKTVQQSFSMDGSGMGFDLLPRFILMLNIYTMGKVVFGLTMFLVTLCLTSLRQFSNVRTLNLQSRNCFSRFVNMWLQKFWLVAQTNTSYYTVIFSIIYLTFGPWFVGELMEGSMGVVFVWGILLDGAFIPGGITYFYGIFQFVTFTGPLILLLSHLLDLRRKYGNRITVVHVLTVFLPSAVLLVFTTYLALSEFPRTYGGYSVLLGPLRTGNVVLLPLSLWLCYRTDLKHVLAINGVH